MCHPAAQSFSLAKSTGYIAKIKAICRGLHVLVMVRSALRCAGGGRACASQPLGTITLDPDVLF